jgi:hypothetical protein
MDQLLCKFRIPVVDLKRIVERAEQEMKYQAGLHQVVIYVKSGHDRHYIQFVQPCAYSEVFPTKLAEFTGEK